MHEPLTFVDLQDAGNAQAQLILCAIARHADWDTGECYPKKETIARMSKCSVRTVFSYLKKLEADGFLEIQIRKRADGGQGANLIKLVGYEAWLEANRNGGHVDTPRKAKRYEQPPGKSCQGVSANLAGGIGKQVATPPGNTRVADQEPSLNNHSNKTRAGEQPANASEEILDDLKSEVEGFAKRMASAKTEDRLREHRRAASLRYPIYLEATRERLEKVFTDRLAELRADPPVSQTDRMIGEGAS